MKRQKKRFRFGFTKFMILTLLVMQFACKNQDPMVQHLADVDVSYVRLSEDQSQNSRIDSIIAPYRAQMEAEMNQEVGSIDQKIVKTRPNSNMGNWFADLMEDAGKELFPKDGVDFAVQNYGGLRVNSILAGTITKRNIFELMPFDNTLVNLTLNQDEVQQLLNRISDYGGWPISKSLRFSAKDSIAVDIMINGKKLGTKDTYQVVLPDYTANGGDNCDFLIGLPRKDSENYIRDVVIDYLEKLKEEGKSFPVDSQPRIKIIE